MLEKKNIATIEDVQQLVDTFYGKVRKDDLIGPIFERVIGDRWGEHLSKMYQFWETVLFDHAYTYKGRPFPPHIPLGLKAEHFERWIAIFEQTLSELFIENEVSQKAKKQANTMATLFQSKLAYFDKEGLTPLG
ncbi:group III truncated hemoglobin [Vaginella massiliensis]|uniref:group III truncated hemoglobin n=1 Tax=Vaginella massiliensis TaxID=1816680 RepID=UPI000837FCEC|nr:group III truncated hemoglobin [Vaginella massiliensis]